ncbi:hypothetical protein BP5796_10179 [Coleophoma crateriformis]|uniref:Uncharacterized protein n=1 Tax=Coleophoma crateriformis TaxID=565419 RepID=A0A3D8QUN7_9HELO|nr:hypothetical protein BP5796_10179 [Coleophoma crateriformis]
MADRKTFKEDEHNVNFDDTSIFASSRWDDAVTSAKENLSEHDRELIGMPREWQTIYSEMEARRIDSRAGSTMKRYIRAIQPLPRSLETLVVKFALSIKPQVVDFSALWGLMHLNMKASIKRFF